MTCTSRVILPQAWRTVEWSRPPSSAPIRSSEVIVLADHSSGASTAGRAEPEKWQTLTSVPAIRAGRLYSVDLSNLNRYGPRVPEGLEILARMIHPEAFK